MLTGILAIVYIVAGYWAVGETIWANWVQIGQYSNIVMRRIVLGFLLGWILIPIALIKMFLGSKS